MGQLAAMARARRRTVWAQTAEIVAMVHNTAMGRRRAIPAKRFFAAYAGEGDDENENLPPITAGELASLMGARRPSARAGPIDRES